jgi:polysaccharide chain length determinant protein (PEP-CTERM system associated)
MMQQQPDLQNSLAIIKESLSVITRHGWGIFLSSVLLAVSGIIAISLLPNMYRATTTILVDPQKIPERYVASTVTSDPNERLNMLTQQVLSGTKLQEIIEQFKLYKDLRKKRSREEVLDFVRGKIKIELKQGSERGLGSFTLTYEDRSPEIAAEVANQLAGSFIDWNLKAREQQALGTRQFLANELDEAKQNLKQQENQLQAYRVQHLGEMPDEVTGNLQALSRLQVELQANVDHLNRLDEERILLTQIRNPETRDPSLLTERDRLQLEKSRLESELWQLKRQYTESYPDVVAAAQQLAHVKAQLEAFPDTPGTQNHTIDPNTQVRLGIIDKEMQRLKQQHATIQGQISSYQAKVDAVPLLETQLAELTRNYETSKQNYQSLLDKTFSAEMAEDLERRQEAERFTILDKARIPEKPFKPKRLPMMAAMVLFSFAISAGAAIAIELATSSMKSEADLRKLVPSRVPILATIPPIASQSDHARRRIFALQSLAISLVACAALIAFLIKVKPVL